VFRWWFPVGTDSIFIDFSRINKGLRALTNQRVPLEGFSVTISRRRRLRFHWLFLSQYRLQELPNTRVTFERCFGDDFWVDNNLVFVDYFWVNRTVGADESTLHLWMMCLDFYLVNRGCESYRIHESPLKGVSVRIFQPALTSFSLTFSKSTGDASASISTRHLWKLFRWRFASQHRLRFRWLFWVNRGRQLFRIHASPLKGVSVMISESITKFRWLFLS